MKPIWILGTVTLLLVAGSLLGQLTQTTPSTGGGGGGGGAVTQSGIWSVRTQDGSGNPLSSTTSAPTGTEQGLVTRNIPSGTQAVSGTVGATQSGTWTVLPGNTANTTPWLTSVSQGGNTATVSAGGALKVDNSGVTQPVSGTVTANAGTGNFTVVQATASNLNTTANQGGTWTVQPGNTANTTPWLASINQGGNTATVSVGGALKVDNSAVTQPVSGTVTANAGTGNFTVVQATAANLNTTANQGGTWTVQPGNTANTTPWLASINQGGNTAVVTARNSLEVEGPVAHGSTGTAINPELEGCVSLSHGANPTAVAANAISRCYSNRAGIPWVIGGHPNVVTTQYFWTSAQTDSPVVAVTAGTKIVVTRASITCARANTVNVAVRLGFGLTTLPTAPTNGTAVSGILLNHDGVAAGSGVVEGVGSGILGVGADGEDLRITTSTSTGGSCSALISYYTIES